MNFLKRLFGAPKVEQKKEELFSSVIGFDDIKEVLSLALKSTESVSIAFVGPPASAKTLFLLDIYNHYKQQSYFIDATNASKVGIFDVCFERRPSLLLIDELWQLKKEHQAALLNLMETGILNKTVHKKIVSTQLKCKVFATMNESKKILEPLKSRFQIFHLPEYTREQFIDIGAQLLMRKGISEATGTIISTIVCDQLDSRDPRQVIRLGNMLKSIDVENVDMNTLKRVVATILKYRGPE